MVKPLQCRGGSLSTELKSQTAMRSERHTENRQGSSSVSLELQRFYHRPSNTLLRGRRSTVLERLRVSGRMSTALEYAAGRDNYLNFKQRCSEIPT
ncbi:hypothetical protein AcW1_007979 [Taiwanofungus camphoratus]|nr:hypothetical protein AcV5_008271 [Antrodia cinnamomea]KAI0950750.1 hypothetical protein AcW1_007979 [Antrodia cinnamomea]KAI0955659.1 hypothetical protein AcV7_006267 [Antrodia cinnamomea]